MTNQSYLCIKAKFDANNLTNEVTPDVLDWQGLTHPIHRWKKCSGVKVSPYVACTRMNFTQQAPLIWFHLQSHTSA